MRSFRWLVVALYVNALLWSIPWVRPMTRAISQAGYSRWTLGGLGVVFALAALAVAFVWARRSGQSLGRSTASLSLFAGAYAGLLWYLSPIPEEVVHVAEYGVLGMLFSRAFGDGAGSSTRWLSVVATGVVGIVDELTQGVTPGRVCDPRDMFVNVLAGAIPLWLLARPGSPGGEGVPGAAAGTA